jgi:amino acid adenylation domain-containing protein
MSDMPAGSCLHEIFADRVREAPHRIAVCAGDERVTYGDLAARAARLAERLRAAGVGPDTLVGLCADKGIPLIVGMLGILEAGGAYVPLDPGYPEERLRLLVSGAGLTRVVADGVGAQRLSGTDVTIFPVAERGGASPAGPSPVQPHHLAYVIHTSGSTGAPKGVLVEHRNVVRLFESTAPWFGFGSDDVWTMFHSASFDFSVWEIWGALLHGGRLVVVPAETTRRPAEFLALLRAEQVTVLSQTPSAFRQLLGVVGDADGLRLRHIVFGGERLDVAMLRPWLDRYGDAQPRLVNMYGITETTVHVTYRRIRSADLAEPGHSPIGVALPDLRVTLHDGAGRVVGADTPGEIWVSGPGVARGYLNRPELTAERFVDGHYRSGDLAIRTAQGDLRYLGRLDDQVQVRGYRVEPYEVESCLSAHPAVRAAVVTARAYPDGDTRLVAYVQPANGSAPERLVDELSRYAAELLPAYLRPAHYQTVPGFALTPQGKVDRAALPAPAASSEPTRAGTDSGAIIGKIVAEVLERDRVGPDDDVFDLGATSLMFIRIVAEVNAQFGVALNGSELGDTASVSAIVAAVDSAASVPAVSVPAAV